MAPGESITVIAGLVDLTHVRNTGAAFGLMPGMQPLFVAVSLIAMIGVAIWWVTGGRHTLTASLAAGLVFGGSIGNLIDRVALGRVTDFVDLKVWPVFNVADSAVVIGVGFMIARLLFAKTDSEAEAAEEVGRSEPQAPNVSSTDSHEGP